MPRFTHSCACSEGRANGPLTVQEWVIRDINGFAGQYARARDVGLDEMADDLLNISDDGRNDWMDNQDPDNPGYDFNGEHFQRSRLRVDTRKWYLSKLAPKRYGEKTALELSGPDGGPIVTTDTERAARIAAILAAGRARKDAPPPDDDDLAGLV
ncbi:MAG: hypothetical protein VB138_13605 [Burkholderia sp.]